MRSMLRLIKKLWNMIFNKEIVYRIPIFNQKEFDDMGASIKEALKQKADNIEVTITGQYSFKDKHLNLNGFNYPKVSISFIGNGAVLSGCYSEHGDLEPQDIGLITEDKIHVAAKYTLFRQCTSEIEILNSETKECRIYHADVSDDLFFDGMLINITQWYTSKYYKVDKIEGNYIYFIADDLVYNTSYKCWSVNLDYGFGRKYPRFRLSIRNKEAIPCYDSNFLYMTNSSFKKVTISGIKFTGNAKKDSLFFFKNTSYPILINKCEFIGIHSDVIKAEYSNNISIRNSSFTGCYNYGINLAFCDNAEIVSNLFISVGLDMTNSFNVRASGKSVYITSNSFVNPMYGAIATGVWWKTDAKDREISCKIVNNTITSNTSRDQLLMDSGAIYTYTQNTDTVICDNRITGYCGMYLNRGIFLDDGAYNVKVVKNTIDCPYGDFAVDSRKVLSVEKNENSFVKRVNHDNSIYDNTANTPIRFEGRDSDANCKFYNNKYDVEGSIINNIYCGL